MRLVRPARIRLVWLRLAHVLGPSEEPCFLNRHFRSPCRIQRFHFLYSRYQWSHFQCCRFRCWDLLCFRCRYCRYPFLHFPNCRLPRSPLFRWGSSHLDCFDSRRCRCRSNRFPSGPGYRSLPFRRFGIHCPACFPLSRFPVVPVRHRPSRHRPCRRPDPSLQRQTSHTPLQIP